MIGKTISHYKILEKLGEGGMGVVYKAHDTKLDRMVALKFLPVDLMGDEAAKKRFMLEARAASALEHLNICNVHEIDETEDGQLFIAMAYYDGETLKERIERGRLKVDEAVDIAIQVAAGLSRGHEVGVVHRDIKPSNIMITTRGDVKILDFGLAKLSGVTRVTKTGETTGTASYMSPEQARGEDVDQRSDIFSFGIVLYEMFTGVYPFRGQYEAARLYSIINDTPQPIIDRDAALPAILQTIVAKALEKDPDLRYQDAGELARDLSALRKAGSRVWPDLRSEKRGSRQRLIALLLVGAFAVLVSTAIYHSYGRRGEDGWTFKSAFSRLTRGKSSLYSGGQLLSVAVAPFWGNSEAAVEEGLVMQGLIIRRLSEILGGEANVRVFAADGSQSPRSHADARALGRKLDACMVLWGEVLALGHEMEIQPHISMVYPLKHTGDTSPQALHAELFEPDQLTLRKAKAVEVGNMAVYAAAKCYAEKDPEKALSLVQTLPVTYSRRFILQGEILGRLGRTNEERKAYEKASEITPSDPVPHLLLAWFFEAKKGAFDEALDEYERAIDLKSDYAWSHVALASFYSRRGRSELALGSLQAARALGPQDVETNSFIAQVLADLGRSDDAVAQYNKTITLSPNDARLRCSLGQVYQKEGQYEKAIAEYEQAASLAPKDPSPPYRIGSAYREAASYQEAVEAFRKSLRLDPTDFSAHIMLGNCYGKLGKRSEAVRAFNRAIEYGREGWGGMIHVFVGVNYSELGWYEAAIAEYGKATEASVDDLFGNSAYYQMGLTYDYMGRHQDALREYKTAVEEGPGPDYLPPHLHYFLSLCRFGRQVEAKAHIDSLSENVHEYRWALEGDILAAVACFYSGQISERQVLELAERQDAKDRSECSRCMARYYLAMSCLVDVDASPDASSVDTTRALVHLEESLDACDKCKDPEYHRRTEVELRRLDGKNADYSRN